MEEGGNCHVSNIEHVSVRLVVYLGDAEMDNVCGVGPTVDAFQDDALHGVPTSSR